MNSDLETLIIHMKYIQSPTKRSDKSVSDNFLFKPANKN